MKSNKRTNILHGDCRSLLKAIKSDSVDLVCTDPPYGIGFMGKEWDTFKSEYIAKKKATKQYFASDADVAGKYSFAPGSAKRFGTFIEEVFREVLRVVKPGGFLFMTMTPRQDSLARVIVGLEDAGWKVSFTSLYWTFASGFPKAANIGMAIDRRLGAERRVVGQKLLNDIRSANYGAAKGAPLRPTCAGALTRQTRSFDGAFAGFQPKPAVEVIVVAMKLLSEKSYVDQALHNGKGFTWLNACRIPSDAPIVVHHAPPGSFAGGEKGRGSIKNYRKTGTGRFPANLIVSDDVLGAYSRFFSLEAWTRETLPFLIVPKAGRREKDLPGGHPTIKPLKLMAYLIAMGSQQGDVVLDPFLGSGTTAIAARLLGRRCIGIEREAEYIALARRRLMALAAQ